MDEIGYLCIDRYLCLTVFALVFSKH